MRFNPWVERPPGGGNGNSLQHPCLKNPSDRGAYWTTVHEIAESDTTKGTHAHMCAHTHTKGEAQF